MKKVKYIFLALCLLLGLNNYTINTQAKTPRVCDGCDEQLPVTRYHYKSGITTIRTNYQEFEFDYTIRVRVVYTNGRITSVDSPVLTFGQIFESSVLGYTVTANGVDFDYTIDSARNRANVEYKVRYAIDGHSTNWLNFNYEAH